MNKNHVFLISLFIITVALLLSHGCHETENTKREAIKAGLIQEQNQFGTPIWVAPGIKP